MRSVADAGRNEAYADVDLFALVRKHDGEVAEAQKRGKSGYERGRYG